MMIDAWAQFSEEQLQRVFRRKQPEIPAELVAAMTREELIAGINGEGFVRLRKSQYNLGY